jgi:hypothetical protein
VLLVNGVGCNAHCGYYSALTLLHTRGLFLNIFLVVLWLALLRYAIGTISEPAILYPLTFATFGVAYASGKLDRRKQACVKPKPTELLPSTWDLTSQASNPASARSETLGTSASCGTMAKK